MPFFGLYRYKICTYLYTDILAMMIINKLKNIFKKKLAERNASSLY